MSNKKRIAKKRATLTPRRKWVSIGCDIAYDGRAVDIQILAYMDDTGRIHFKPLNLSYK